MKKAKDPALTIDQAITIERATINLKRTPEGEFVAYDKNGLLLNASFAIQFVISALTFPHRLKNIRFKFDVEYKDLEHGIQMPGQTWTYLFD